jgi:hypothetical protein
LGPAHVTVTHSIIEGSARAGAAAFGATVELGATRLECNPIHLDGEIFNDVPFGFVDLGADVCGCQNASVACQVLSSHLTPPELPPNLPR